MSFTKNSWIIGDKEVEDLDSGGDLLGTKSYVEILDKIINDITVDELGKGYNIGLYGGWGSGKSSILRTLVEKNKNNEKLNFVWFDCWKYSKDDFRRTFLFEIVDNYKKYGISEDVQEDLLKSAYKNIGLSESGDEPDFKLGKGSFFVVLICFLIISGLLYVASLKWPGLRESNVFKIIIFSFSLLIWIFEFTKEFIYKSLKSLAKLDKSKIIKGFQDFLNQGNRISDLSIDNIQYLTNLLPKVTRTSHISEGKLFSGEQFEDWFKCLIFDKDGGKFISLSNSSKDELNRIQKNYKWEKHIFILDNIDRCGTESIHEIFMTIKSFLNQRNCIFIIPIDYESVCALYNNDFKTSDNNYKEGNEFLRKIFNVGIHLNTPIYDKLYEFTKEIIEKNWNIEDNKKDNNIFTITKDEVEEISCTLSGIFSKNPRKIKQFLNKLSTEYERLKDSLNKHKLEGENTSWLISTMKRLIIQQEIPNLYKYLLENPFYENKIIEYIEGENSKEYLQSKQKEEKDPIFKNIPNLSEQSFDLIKKLSWLDVKILVYSDASILINYIDKPEAFFQIINGNKNLQKEARDIIINKATTHTTSRYLGISLVNLCIGFIGHYGFDREMFMSVFKKELTNLWLYENINISNEMLYSFLNKVNLLFLKKMRTHFFVRFTNKLINNIDEECILFNKLDDNKKQLLINGNTIINIIESGDISFNIKASGIEGTNIYKFMSQYNKYVDSKTIDNLVHKLPDNINGFSGYESFNILKLCQLIGKIPESSISSIENAMNGFIPNRLANYNNLTPLNSKIKIESYFILAEIAILSKSKSVNNIIKTFNSIYNQSNSTSKKMIQEILEKDIKTSAPYNWPYIEFAIDRNLSGIIGIMIDKTSENEYHAGLNESQINKIIDNIDVLGYDLLNNIWKFNIGKKVLFDNLKNKKYPTIYKMIEYLDTPLNIKISSTDIRIIKKLITDNVCFELNNSPFNSVSTLNNFIDRNQKFINYLYKRDLFNTLSEIRKREYPNRTIRDINQLNDSIDTLQNKIKK